MITVRILALRHIMIYGRLIRFCLLLCLVGLSPSILTGQSYDANWVLSNGLLILDFKEEPPGLEEIDSVFPVRIDNSSISDAAGKLWYYFNGCFVRGADYKVIMNGDSLNAGPQSDLQCGGGNIAVQGSMFLPAPGMDDKLYLLHMNLDFFPPHYAVGIELFYSIIDSESGPTGTVVEKNQLLLRDTFSTGLITACRHANGRDWWILLPEVASNKFYRFLLDTEGIHGPWEQRIGTVDQDDSGGGWVAFSEDGNYYARVDEFNDLHVFHFDRCSGLLSNHQFVEIPDIGPNLGYHRSLAFSPNNQFLYISGPEYLHQLDLQATSLQNSMQLVGEFDGYGDPFPGYFERMKLAPDGKIYVFPGNSNYYLNVIEEPDKRGEDCHFTQHEFALPIRNYTYPPNIPNFNLSRMVGSPCDTLFAPPVDIVCGEDQISANPNPFQQNIRIDYEACSLESGVFYLYDALGRKLWQEEIRGDGMYEFHIPDYPSGIYVYQILSAGERLKSGKLVKD
ncbi:MAG: T9SS type A sorting domain-containing protein [Bacteroidetes bacterium]|nr:T9SS type A sorting domain-containing protein [Bacteroidota bacterium]